MDLVLLNELYQMFDPVAFWVGPFAVRWYGLGYIVGILLGGVVIKSLAKRWKIYFSVDALLTLYIASIVGIIFGARIGYVLIYGAGYYFEYPAEILNFSGMSFHGGVMGMALAILVTSRIFKMPFASLADLVVIAAPIGIFLVRCANFINGELWGTATDLPWGVVFDRGGDIARHPTQLYEALLEGVVLFVIMMVLARRKTPLGRGSYLGIFFIAYSVFRIAVEFVRVPDAQIGYLAGGWLTMGMVLSAILLLVGVAILLYATKANRPQVGLPEPEDFEDLPEDEDLPEGKDLSEDEDLETKKDEAKRKKDEAEARREKVKARRKKNAAEAGRERDEAEAKREKVKSRRVNEKPRRKNDKLDDEDAKAVIDNKESKAQGEESSIKDEEL